MLRAAYPCSKSDSTMWCREAAAHSAVLPFENRKVAKANTEREMLQRALVCANSEMCTVKIVTCQVKRPDEELHNALAWYGTRPYCVGNGSASANVCFDRCLHFACDLASKNDDVMSLSRQPRTRSRSASVLGETRCA